MHKRLLTLVLTISLISVVIIWGWQRFNSKSGETAYITSDYITISAISDLAHQSDTVVVGTVAKVDDQHFNTARNTRDPSQPAIDLFINGTIYEIQVEQYVKGSGGSNLRIVQSEDITLPNTAVEAPTVYLTEGFTPLEVGARYIFFLKVAESYPDSPFSDLYRGTAEPYRFRLENGMAKAESPSRLARDLFPMEKEDALIQEVITAIAK